MNELGNTPADKNYKPSGISRAEELASRAAYAWQSDKDGNLTLEMFPDAFYRGFLKGYEQAEKDTTERAISWLKEHADDYIVDLTPSYPDAPVNIIVGGMCWEHLKNFLEK